MLNITVTNTLLFGGFGLLTEENYYCATCSTYYDNPDLMCWVKGVMRRRCKNCHRLCEKIRREKMTPERRKEIGTRNYLKQVERNSNLDESKDEDLKTCIKLWIQTNTNRRTEGRFKERKGLDRKNLTNLCFVAKTIFPYITFNNNRKKDKTAHCWASLDRIDPNKPYTDDNVVVVPLWLNSAKLDSDYFELFKLVDDLNREDFLNHVENCKKLHYKTD